MEIAKSKDATLRSFYEYVETIALLITISSGKNKYACFPYISYLFEGLETNLMELNLSELTLISFNSI
jgi:hypothetical protein